MARKTFISYKWSEARSLRDKIIDALGDDATYYTGETSDSPDLTDGTTENIREVLKTKIYGTSVLIVVVSQNFLQSAWIDWEIEYALKEIKRGDKTSRTNGLVGVIMKHNGDYDWLTGRSEYKDGCTPRTIDNNKLYPIVHKNRFNRTPPKYICEVCKTVDKLEGSYLSLIEEDDFLEDPQKYIENAYDKSEIVSNYVLTKIR